MSVRDEQGEEQEVGGPLVLAGVEEQLQDRRILDQSHAHLVQELDQLRLHNTTAVCWTERQQSKHLTCSTSN